MDLGRCPKCGVEWRGGEFCASCGFVPIGAGLDKLPKKKKRKVRKYVEPGSGAGTLFLIFLVVVGGGLFMYQPWRDDWALVRMLMGDGRPHSVLGNWEITKTVNSKSEPPVLVAKRTDRGGFTFGLAGQMSMRLGAKSDQDRLVASGKYELSGRQLVLTSLQADGNSEFPFPERVTAQLTWMGPDSFVAYVNRKEIIYARRKQKKGSDPGMLRLALGGKGTSAGSN